MSITVEPKPVVQRRWRQPLFAVLRIGVVSYLGVVLVFLFLENSFVYHPTSADEFWKQPTFSGCQEIEFQTDDGLKIDGWWCPVPDKAGVVLFCHGNAGNLSHWHDLIPQLQQDLGMSVLIFDYPGFGRSEGRVSEAGCYASADAAYRWLTEKQHIPAEEVVIYGVSLGGGVAVDLASRQPHRALILANTFTSLPDIGQGQYPWLPVRWAMRNRFDSLSKIGNCHRPIAMAHGTGDGLIPFRQAEALYAAAGEPKLFFPVENGNHDTLPPPAFYRQLRHFLAEKASLARK